MLHVERPATGQFHYLKSQWRRQVYSFTFLVNYILKTDRYVRQEARVREHARARTLRTVYVPRASFIHRVSLKHAENVPCGET